MIGVYDFCGHYEWTFEWLRQRSLRDHNLALRPAVWYGAKHVP